MQCRVRACRGSWPGGCGLSNPITDCLRCGVCCHSKLDTYVRLTGDDWERLGAEADHVAHFIGNRAYMRMSERGHCAALDVRVTADGAREFFCTVYEKRPQICRDLARGSPECEGERLAKGERVGS
ncbi:MAG: YkgJ family cysteine cluster protein [Opitutaceae bacterium]|nr:YkgJ family cysteine cluster protein [Opitutaceae bacterium]